MTAWTDDTNLRTNDRQLRFFILISCSKTTVKTLISATRQYIVFFKNINYNFKIEKRRDGGKKKQKTKSGTLSNLADTMTASPSLHLSAGMDLRHCLESKKRPGKNTDPAARMVNMVPEGLSEGYKVQQAIQSQSPATLSSLEYKT